MVRPQHVLFILIPQEFVQCNHIHWQGMQFQRDLVSFHARTEWLFFPDKILRGKIVLNKPGESVAELQVFFSLMDTYQEGDY